MDFTELASQLQSRAQIAIEPHWAGYQQSTPHPTSDGFLFWLKQNRIIDADLFTALHTSGSLDMTVAEPSLAYRATHQPQAGHARTSAPPAAETTHYEVLGELGKGAMGEVHLARDIVLRRKVAMKSILPEMQQNAQLLSRFLGEMQITAQLDHPFIVPIYGVEDGPSGGLAYTMKVVQGRELGDLLDETRALLEARKPLPPANRLEARLEVFLKVCDAVAYANERGIVHRDLKPANVMIGAYNVVYVMDWGISRLMGDGGRAQDQGVELYDAQGGNATQATRTRIGSTIGTPIYMSPEQASGKNDELDGRSDLYALGLILQEVVTLTRAIGGTTLQEVLTNAKDGKRLPAHPAIGSTVPQEIQAIVDKATRFHPNDRYASVTAFADDIRRYLRNEAITAKPDTSAQRAGRWVSKNRIATLVLLLTALVVGAAGIIGVLLYNRATVARQHNRELRLAELQASSAIRAQELDGALQSYEALLSRMAGAAAFALSEDRAGEAVLHFEGEFQAGPGALPGLIDSRYYGKQVSFEWPVASVAPGAAKDLSRDRGTVETLRALARETMIASSRADYDAMSPADRDRALAETGSPISRIVVTLENGVHLEYPGMAGPSPDLDGRKDPLYVAATRSREPIWGAPGEGRQGAVTLPCSTALRDAAGKLVGVLTVEVDLTRALTSALSTPTTVRVDASLVVNRAGDVVAQAAGGSGSDGAAGTKPREELGMPRVKEALERGESGTMQTERNGRPVVVTYQPLSTVDWYLITAAGVDSVEQTRPAAETNPGSIAARAAPPPKVAPPHPPPAAAPAPANATAEPAPAASASAAPSSSAAPSAAPTLSGKMPTAAPSAPPAPSEPASPFDPWDKYKKKKEEAQ